MGSGVNQAEVRHQRQAEYLGVAVGIGDVVDVLAEVDVRQGAEQHIVGALEVALANPCNHVVEPFVLLGGIGLALDQLEHPRLEDFALDVAGELAQFSALDVAVGSFYLAIAGRGAADETVDLGLALGAGQVNVFTHTLFVGKVGHRDFWRCLGDAGQTQGEQSNQGSHINAPWSCGFLFRPSIRPDRSPPRPTAG
ncbi:hypothetical protein D3C85_1392000 [compost metagenome]